MKKIKLDKTSSAELKAALMKRNPAQYNEYESIVNEICKAVADRGDEALFDYTARFDGWAPTDENIRVSEEEIRAAFESVDPRLIKILEDAAENIRQFHQKQVPNSWIETREDGSILGMKVTPIESVGCYAPGGKAAYPSSVLMNIIPAKVAGVERIVLVTPCSKGNINPVTLAAAAIAGATEIYKIGGAQAVAALAYGTKSVPKVCKITGPGNIFVALAKKACFGMVGIDSIAGPSEILVIADETANPRYVAADLLSQAEHDELASAILLTTSVKLAEDVEKHIEAFLTELDRRDIIRKSLDNYGYICIGMDEKALVDAANEIASEHLEILTGEPFKTMTAIKNAGAIFLGESSCEPLGDYYAGPNHILPTNGTARFFSPLNVEEFVKRSSIISYSREALSKVHEDIEYFAMAEGLSAHANSIKVRFE